MSISALFTVLNVFKAFFEKLLTDEGNSNNALYLLILFHWLIAAFYLRVEEQMDSDNEVRIVLGDNFIMF